MKIFNIEFEEDSDYPIRKKGYEYFQNQSEELNKLLSDVGCGMEYSYDEDLMCECWKIERSRLANAIRNIENTPANEIARCFSANYADSKDAEDFKKKIISDLKALNQDFQNENNKYCFIYWL